MYMFVLGLIANCNYSVMNNYKNLSIISKKKLTVFQLYTDGRKNLGGQRGN